MRGTAAVEHEDARIEIRGTPGDRPAGTTEIKAHWRTIGAETRPLAAGQANLSDPAAQSTGEVSIRLEHALVTSITRDVKVTGTERTDRRTNRQAKTSFAEEGGPGVGIRPEQGSGAVSDLHEGYRIGAIIDDRRIDDIAVPGDIVELVARRRSGRKFKSRDGMRSPVRKETAAFDDKGGIGGAGNSASRSVLDIERLNRESPRANRGRRREFDVAG